MEKLEMDVDINAPAPKLYEIFYATPHQLPKISPTKIQVCKLLEGDWGKNGSILHWNYLYDGKSWMTKDVIEGVDEGSNSITLTTIEGGLMEYYKTFKTTLRVFPKAEGSVVRWTFEYEKVNEQAIDLHVFLQYHVDLSKEIDDHLTRND